MSFYLASPSNDARESIATFIIEEDDPIRVPTVKDVSMSKKDFFKSLTRAEINEFKAMAFDVLMHEMQSSDDEYVSYLQALVQDVVDDGEPFFWPSNVKEAPKKAKLDKN